MAGGDAQAEGGGCGSSWGQARRAFLTTTRCFVRHNQLEYIELIFFSMDQDQKRERELDRHAGHERAIDTGPCYLAERCHSAPLTQPVVTSSKPPESTLASVFRTLHDDFNYS